MPTTVARIVYNRLPEIKRRLPQACQEIALETAYEVEGIVKEGMAEGKSGRMYGSHQASAPGEMPAIDTSALVNSITTEAEDGGAVVYSDEETAVHMEFGAPMAHIEPRPFFGPAAQQAQPGYVRAMRGLERRL